MAYSSVTRVIVAGGGGGGGGGTGTDDSVSPMQFGAFADGTNHGITQQNINDHSAGGSMKTWVGTVARIVTDGVITAGSQTVTSATANFTSADRAQRITGTGIPPNSRITTVVDSATVKINTSITFLPTTNVNPATFSIGDYQVGDFWDYVGLQEAIYAAFQNSSLTPNKDNRWLNKPLHIPAGR